MEDIEIINEELLNKGFVYGGLRGNKSNIFARINTPLTPTEKLPYFKGYPNTYSVIEPSESGYSILHTELLITNPNAVNIKVRGCYNVYVKFLNSLGGYSYWMFESYTDEQKNTNSGIINNHVSFDLGNKLDQEIELYSKVPRDFIPLIQDLIISPEIYIYDKDNDEYNKYYSSSNTVQSIPYKAGQKLKIKLKPFTNYNPQVLWQ